MDMVNIWTYINEAYGSFSGMKRYYNRELERNTKHYRIPIPVYSPSTGSYIGGADSSRYERGWRGGGIWLHGTKTMKDGALLCIATGMSWDPYAPWGFLKKDPQRGWIALRTMFLNKYI
jgi:hypothetical protein